MTLVNDQVTGEELKLWALEASGGSCEEGRKWEDGLSIQEDPGVERGSWSGGILKGMFCLKSFILHLQHQEKDWRCEAEITEDGRDGAGAANENRQQKTPHPSLTRSTQNSYLLYGFRPGCAVFIPHGRADIGRADIGFSIDGSSKRGPQWGLHRLLPAPLLSQSRAKRGDYWQAVLLLKMSVNVTGVCAARP